MCSLFLVFLFFYFELFYFDLIIDAAIVCSGGLCFDCFVRLTYRLWGSNCRLWACEGVGE